MASTPNKLPGIATPHSQDLRDRVLGAYDRGMPTGQIAAVFKVSPAGARRVT